MPFVVENYQSSALKKPNIKEFVDCSKWNSIMARRECWSLVPKLEQDYFVVIYCIAIYLLADSYLSVSW